MASLAEKRMEDAEDHPIDQNDRSRGAAGGIAASRSAAVCLRRADRSGDAGQAHARRRRRQGGAGAAAGGICPARRQSGARCQQMDLSHRRRSVVADDARESTETRRLSRAAIEVLAIIAYHQPVTRAEIEDIRGVITSKGTLDVLLETGWIRPRGRRKTPGRPLTFGTNRSVPVAVQPGSARRPSGSRRVEGYGTARFAVAFRLQRSDAVRRRGPA